MRHCVICGEEFATEWDTLDHGHDEHGLFHFQDPTTDGPRPVDMKYPLSFEEIEDRTFDWNRQAWEQDR